MFGKMVIFMRECEDFGMKYLLQTGIILLITWVGELLAQVLPLPIPGSIYGMVLLFFLLFTKIIKVNQVENVGNFLLTILPFLFISNCVSLMDSMGLLGKNIVIIVSVTVVSTLAVMVITGGVAQLFMNEKEKHTARESKGGCEDE